MIEAHSANDKNQYEIDLPSRPAAWNGWRVAMEPTFWLTDNNGVGPDFFPDNTVDSFEEGVAKFFDERQIDPVGFRCYAIDVTPAFEWYAKWTLLRRSKRGRFVRRRARQGPAPWEYYADNTLFEVARRPDGPMCFSWTYILSAGGRTKEEADENWYFWARHFRRGRRAHLRAREQAQ